MSPMGRRFAAAHDRSSRIWYKKFEYAQGSILILERLFARWKRASSGLSALPR